MLELLMANTYDAKNIMIALGFTIIAGLSTGIGSLLALFAKKTNTRFLAVALGFRPVMIYVSFVEIFLKARDALVANLKQARFLVNGRFVLWRDALYRFDRQADTVRKTRTRC